VASRPGIWDHSTALLMCLVGVLCAPLAPTVSLYHPSDFLRSAPSFSGCCRQDLERAAGHSRFNDVTTDFPAPFEDISVSAFFL